MLNEVWTERIFYKSHKNSSYWWKRFKFKLIIHVNAVHLKLRIICDSTYIYSKKHVLSIYMKKRNSYPMFTLLIAMSAIIARRNLELHMKWLTIGSPFGRKTSSMQPKHSKPKEIWIFTFLQCTKKWDSFNVPLQSIF